MIRNDVDIEMLELHQRANEDLNETCWACGDSYQSITTFVSAVDRHPHAEVYTCVCGHRSVWIGRKRQS